MSFGRSKPRDSIADDTMRPTTYNTGSSLTALLISSPSAKEKCHELESIGLSAVPMASLLFVIGALVLRDMLLVASLNQEVVSIESDQIRFLLLGDWGLYGTGGSKYSLQKKDKVSSQINPAELYL